jgi:hypothetical protein
VADLRTPTHHGTDPAPLRYVGVPPTFRMGRTVTLSEGTPGGTRVARPNREVDRGRHDLCGYAAIPAFQLSVFHTHPDFAIVVFHRRAPDCAGRPTDRRLDPSHDSPSRPRAYGVLREAGAQLTQAG